MKYLPNLRVIVGTIAATLMIVAGVSATAMGSSGCAPA
jgi:hypothetical protein